MTSSTLGVFAKDMTECNLNIGFISLQAVCSRHTLGLTKITKKHIEKHIRLLHFSIYCDDGLVILVNEKYDQQAYQHHLDSLHPNL